MDGSPVLSTERGYLVIESSAEDVETASNPSIQMNGLGHVLDFQTKGVF